MTQPSEEALGALRDVWQSQGQGAAEIDEVCDTPRQKICKNSVHMTFDGYAEDGGDVQSAWKERLAKEGKLSTKGGSLRDLMMQAAEDNG